MLCYFLEDLLFYLSPLEPQLPGIYSFVCLFVWGLLWSGKSSHFVQKESQLTQYWKRLLWSSLFSWIRWPYTYGFLGSLFYLFIQVAMPQWFLWSSHPLEQILPLFLFIKGLGCSWPFSLTYAFRIIFSSSI